MTFFVTSWIVAPGILSLQKLGAGGSSIGFDEDRRLEEIRTPSFKVPLVDSNWLW